MTREEFEKIVEQEFPNAIPEKFHHVMRNVAFLVEDEPDQATCREEGLTEDETLLGLYRGIPIAARGEQYGVGATLPDTIMLYRLSIEKEAQSQQAAREGKTWPSGPERTLLQPAGEEYVRQVVRETIWHEVAHHFGYDEDQVQNREAKRSAEE